MAIAAVAIIAFSAGLAFGGRGAANIGSSPSPPPALTGASVSSQLWTAYLNVISGGWAICSITPTVVCQPELAIPGIEFQDFATLPLTVSANDWGVLTAANVPPGHYVLAGPMSIFMTPQVSLTKVAADGTGSLIGLGDQVVLDGVTYVDLGTLTPGRYAGVVSGYQLQPGASSGVINGTLIGWAVGMVVGP